MSEEINQCIECGCKFLNPPKGVPKVKHWFSCDCGTTYIQRKETGLWYEEDEYHDKFDEIDEYFAIKKEEMN